MKKTLPAAALLALSVGPALAQSSVTLSGIADAAARSVSNQGLGSVKSLVSGSNSTSRLIFRGTEDLGGGLRASFWLETGILVDSGASASANFFDRRSTLSLSGRNWGELRLGRDFVPSYVGWSRFDPFSYVGVAATARGVSATPQGPIRSAFGSNDNTTVRASNAIQYFLPGGLGGLEGHAMVAAGEGSSASNNKTLAARVGWSGGPVSVSAAYTTTENGATVSSLGKFKDTAVGGSWNLGAGRVNLAWRKFEHSRAEQTNLMISGQLNLGSHEVKASVMDIDMAGRVGNTVVDANDARMLGLGYVYNLSKRSALYASYGGVDNEGAATFVVPGGPSGLAGGKSSKGYEFGVRHSF